MTELQFGKLLWEKAKATTLILVLPLALFLPRMLEHDKESLLPLRSAPSIHLGIRARYHIWHASKNL